MLWKNNRSIAGQGKRAHVKCGGQIELLLKKMTFQQGHGGAEVSPVDPWRRNILSRYNSQCKGPSG